MGKIPLSPGGGIMEKLTYNWISEEYKPRVCVTTDRPCRMKQCPAWYSRGDGIGRCLLVPGYILPEEEE